ncbi:MAG TPA: BsuPI-related putative proteinase inhibitor [Bryobacteraceae bacterium]|nr:BsuPI-related putative proteinase inhibitor [Bryobacteraceae bacterium]
MKCMIKYVCATALLVFPVFASTPDYFPLEAGNSWTYRSEGRFGTNIGTIEVLRADVIDGRTWHLVDFFGRPEWLRVRDDGALVAWDATARREKLWFNFAEEEKRPFATEFDQCVKAAQVESKSARYNGPLGSFTNALLVRFEPACADAGATQATFLPYVGLVSVEMTSIAGPRTWQLIQARMGLTEVSTGLVSSRLSLDSHVYASGSREMLARLSVRNTTARPLVLNFRSGQRYDLNIRNDRGETVYVWSADKGFIQVLGTETIAPGGERSWVIIVPLATLRPGRYVAEAWVTNDLPKSYAASVGFEVAEVTTQQPR